LVIDKKSREAVEIAERYARGEATEGEWNAAGDAAWAAARAAQTKELLNILGEKIKITEVTI
jgi:hypothetical protein